MDEKKTGNLDSSINSRENYQPKEGKIAQPGKAEFDKLKAKLDSFKKKVLKKFGFTRVLGILPAKSFPLFEEEENLPKEVVDSKPIHLIMVVPEDQFKNIQKKIAPEVINLVKESGENLWIHFKTEVDLWNYGLDSRFEFLDAISAAYPLHDKGFLGALRVASIHKSLVLNWLNTGRQQYVATYAIGGSLARGTADKTSDVDTFVIIDDTDVKRMSRIELIEKLRGRIVGDYVREATALAGVKNILNVQVYLLTDFWQAVKDAQPIMFTFIRDGIPLYDIGTFIPWKRLLQMGKIRPSPEAIEQYMREGDRTDNLVKRRMLDAMVDVYFGIVTPTQSLMMLAGHAPPVPKTIVQEVKDVLVEKENVMGQKELSVLEKAVKMYKDYEHGKLKEVSGKEIDEMMKECKNYIKSMKEIRDKLEARMREHQADSYYSSVFDLMKQIFGNKNQEALIKELETRLVKEGKVHPKMLEIAREISKIKQKAKSKKLTQSEMQRMSRDASELTDALTEYSQRKEFVSLQKGIVQISYKGGSADVVLTDSGVFVSEVGGRIRKIENNGLVDSGKEELEKALKETKDRLRATIPSGTIDVLRKEFGQFEIIV